MPNKFREPEYTGRMIVALRQDSNEAAVKFFEKVAGLRMLERGSEADTLGTNEIRVFPNLGVAVVSAEPDRMISALDQSENNAILVSEPERMNYSTASLEYFLGYRDGIAGLVDKLAANGHSAAPNSNSGLLHQFSDTQEATWGLEATVTTRSRWTGRGIKIAILDTGIDLSHPDLNADGITTRSFIPGETIDDVVGHGTHCAGTACGPTRQGTKRYGVASDATLYVGKVLNNRGRGPDGGILAGIDWAIMNGCDIISMSLGSGVALGQSYSRVYEIAANRALNQGTLILAAAGNGSERSSDYISAVDHPANCPSIMAVAAIDSSLSVADFSCGGLNPNGGQVDIAGPGVAIYSTWPMPTKYRSIDGTSMATPHVAGLAALHAEATQERGRALWAVLVQAARRLPLQATDVGAGLAQAP